MRTGRRVIAIKTCRLPGRTVRLRTSSQSTMCLCSVRSKHVRVHPVQTDLQSGEIREIALKTASDGWLVGRLSGEPPPRAST